MNNDLRDEMLHVPSSLPTPTPAPSPQKACAVSVPSLRGRGDGVFENQGES